MRIAEFVRSRTGNFTRDLSAVFLFLFLFLMILGLAMLLAVALHPTRLRTTLRPSCRLIVALDLFPSLPEGLDADLVLYRACVATVQATCPCAS